MKKIYLPIIAIIVTNFSFSQTKETKEADNFFDKFEYVNAANSYLKLTQNEKSSPYVYKQLADCYYNVFNTKEAVKWYTKATETTQNAETYYRYAQMLKAEGQLEESNKQMNQFASMKPNDTRAKEFLNVLTKTEKKTSTKKLFEVEKSKINSENTDFGAFLTNDNQLYFVSSRNTGKKKSSMNEEQYLDIYKSTKNTDGTITDINPVSELNSKWHDGPLSITSDGNIMYYASESFNENKFQKNKEKHLKYSQIYLYKSIKNSEGKWSTGIALPINSPNYSMRNPSISLDGKTLYFSSDMPGGHGGEDIWSVTVNGDTYGKPQNLGSQVNTEGHESFPSIIDNNLYFASNGKQGLGGYDIFVYNIENKENSVNLDSPINSLKDDFSFTLNKELKQGYFASNRDGNDDIFQATPICYFNPKLTVKDKETGVLLEDAIVNLYNSEGNLIAKEKTNTKGEVSFEVLCKDKYKAITERNGYENGNIEVLNKPESNNATEVLLEPIKPIITDTEIILQPIFFEYNESFITALGAQELDKLVSILEIKETIKIHIKAHTDSRGNDKYNLVLSEKRAKSTQEYIISKGIARDRITSEGKGETELKVNCSNCSEEEHAQNRRSEFLIK